MVVWLVGLFYGREKCGCADYLRGRALHLPDLPRIKAYSVFSQEPVISNVMNNLLPAVVAIKLENTVKEEIIKLRFSKYTEAIPFCWALLGTFIGTLHPFKVP